MRKRTVRILTILGILIVALAALYALAVGVSALKLHSAYAALERDGRPMELADVAGSRIPDTQNAAPLYESAILLLEAQAVGDGNLLRHLSELSADYMDGSADPNQRAELHRLMDRDVVVNALRAVEQGTTRPNCQFNLTYNDRGSYLLPPLAGIRSLGHVLAANALLEAEAGRPDEAWQAATIQLRFADLLRTGPSFIVSQLVRLAQINLACTTIQRLCDYSPPAADQCQHIQALLKDLDDTGPLVPAFDGDRLAGERLFNLPKYEFWGELGDLYADNHYSLGPFFEWVRFQWVTFKPRFLADHAAYLRLMHGYVKLLEQPYQPNEAEAFDKLYRDISRGHTFTAIMAPAMGRIREMYLRMIAETRVTRAGLAVLQYRDANGAFPESLDALGLDYAQDPFSQKPLLYRPAAEEFVIYSIGPDQQDDGGTPRQGSALKYDVVWRFPGRNR